MKILILGVCVLLIAVLATHIRLNRAGRLSRRSAIPFKILELSGCLAVVVLSFCMLEKHVESWNRDTFPGVVMPGEQAAVIVTTVGSLGGFANYRLRPLERAEAVLSNGQHRSIELSLMQDRYEEKVPFTFNKHSEATANIAARLLVPADKDLEGSTIAFSAKGSCDYPVSSTRGFVMRYKEFDVSVKFRVGTQADKSIDEKEQAWGPVWFVTAMLGIFGAMASGLALYPFKEN